MIESGLIGLLSSVVAILATRLAFNLRRKRQIRIATDIANTVTAELGEYNPNAIRKALDKKDPSCNLMRVYFNHVRKAA